MRSGRLVSTSLLVGLLLLAGAVHATISSTTSRVNYTGSGSTATYAYTFRILAASDLLVTKRTIATGAETTLALNADYTVTGVGVGSGGSITLTAGNLPSTHTLTIRRVLPLTQPTDLRNQGPFLAETHETAFDRFIMIHQQQQDVLGRSVRLPESVPSSSFNPELPATIVSASGKYLAVNGTGTAWELIPVNAGGLFTSPAITGTVTGGAFYQSILPQLASYPTASLPPAGTAGRLARVTDGIRGIWKDTGIAWVSVTGWADVRDFTDVPTAVTALGSTVATLAIANTQVIASNLTIPATLTLAFIDQGKLSVSTGATVTILGPLVAPMRQIFSGASTAPVLFGTGSVEQLYPEWFGAKGDGVITYDARVYSSGTDDSAALQATFNASMNSAFRPKIVLSARLYYFTTPLTITFARGMHIEGAAGGQFGDTDTGFRDMVTTLLYNGSGVNSSGLTIGNGSNSATGFVMEHVFMNAGSLAETASGVNGIRLNLAAGSTLRDVTVSNFKGSGAAGLLIEGTQLSSFYNLGFTNNTIGVYEKGTATENTTNRFYNCVWHTNGTGYLGTGSTGTLLEGSTFQNNTGSAVAVTSASYNTNAFTMRDYYIASNASSSAVPAVDLQGSATYTLWNPRIEDGFFASAGAVQTASIRYMYSRQGIISHPRMGDITRNKFFIGTTNLEFMFLGWNSSLGNAFIEDGAGAQVPWPRLGVEQPYFLTSYSPFKVLQGKTDLNTAALTIEQGNVSKALVNFVGTTEAGASKNLTSWLTGATLAGYAKVEINGTAYWMPFYNAPTGP